MERLNKTSPSIKVSDEQKKELAQLDSVCAAKVAEREIHFKAKIQEAQAAGNWGEAEAAQNEWNIERKKLQTDLEEKKDRARKI